MLRSQGQRTKQVLGCAFLEKDLTGSQNAGEFDTHNTFSKT